MPRRATRDPGWVIRTGIPAIDGMFRIREDERQDRRGGIGLPSVGMATSLCIVGPQGTGKSVMAMHVAARYLADCYEAIKDTGRTFPRVCYVSTDMTYPAAKPMLQRFALDRPNARQVPFIDYETPFDPGGNPLIPPWLERNCAARGRIFTQELNIRLALCPADNPDSLALHVLEGVRPRKKPELDIAFVDLASRTAGDDWAFVHRLLGVLPAPERTSPRHLLVVDAIEGLETFGGELDAFGESSTRRARIAKLMRLATDKCHVVAIVEEAAEGTRLPEEFVSDVVFRLRSVDAHGYQRRTLQIEKARGQSAVRGQHPYVIRSGRGSTTGTTQNYDDPEVFQVDDRRSYQSYVELFPSLHYASRSIMISAPAAPPKKPTTFAGFGIEYLDDMLAEASSPPGPGSDPRGLPGSTVTALIGDAGTQKTGLGIAFLGQSFAHTVRGLLAELGKGELDKKAPAKECREWIRKRYAAVAGVPILITTQKATGAELAETFERDLLPLRGTRGTELPRQWRDALREVMVERTICRRLEIHDMPSPVLFNIVKRAIEAGQRIINGGNPDPIAGRARPVEDIRERFAGSWRIRLVIDDLSTIIDTYTQIKRDPLFLPFLVFHLKREGPTSLIIDTRLGRPDEVTAGGDGFHTDLRVLADNRIYTWPVTEFYGDHRVAIAAIPPIARDGRARVREVKRSPDRDLSGREELFVDPAFELYSGLRENRPEPVPLEVRLYGETEGCRRYAEYLNDILKRVYRANPERQREGGAVVVSERPEDYDVSRDASYLKVDTHLDHSLLVQIDEFWPQGHHGDLERKYLLEEVDPRHPRYHLIRDPFHAYRKTDRAHGGPRYKGKFFAGHEYAGVDPSSVPMDRVPYTWDFGFMACREDAWRNAAAADSELRTFWEWYARSESPTTAEPPGEALTWRSFLKHACAVAKIESDRTRQYVPAFDLGLMLPEAFSCLVLEVWASEICLTLKNQEPGGKASFADDFAARVGNRPWLRRGNSAQKPQEDREGLWRWLAVEDEHRPTRRDSRFPGWTMELYKTWLLLVEALDLEALARPGSRDRVIPHKANPHAVSVRHWYKTACDASEEERAAMGPVYYGRLPGRFSIRGDWFLAVAPESRSYPLASRALDLLCSTRGNMRRLQLGVGLPTRLLGDNQGTESFRTALPSGLTLASPALSYGDVVALGPSAEGLARRWEDDEGRLGWMWRSALKSYNRQALAWQSWLFHMAADWWRLRQVRGAMWRNGFDLYDEITNREKSTAQLPDEIKNLDSFKNFPRQCQELIAALRLVDPQ